MVLRQAPATTMADLKASERPPLFPDDISDAASSHLEVQSLKDEELPSYSDEPAASSSVLATGAPAATEKSALAREQYAHVAGSSRTPPPIAELPGTTTTASNEGPTASSPFNFPISELPAYEDAIDITKPLCIPQITPSPDAPFLSAFSRQLLSYGIPAQTWYNFVDTLSAFVSANISQQALHHAAEVGALFAEFQKEYAYEVTKKAKNIGKSAQHLQLGGVIGGVMGIATHSVGHVFGTVFNAHRNIWTKPKTPRQRATVYIATANKDWFHSRGLHALLLDTQELATVLGLPFQNLIAATNTPDLIDPVKQLGALREYIAEVEVRKVEEPPAVPFNPTTSGNPMATPSGANFASSSHGPAETNPLQPSSSNASGKRPVISHIHIGVDSLWLVLTQESKIQAMQLDQKANSTTKNKKKNQR